MILIANKYDLHANRTVSHESHRALFTGYSFNVEYRFSLEAALTAKDSSKLHELLKYLCENLLAVKQTTALNTTMVAPKFRRRSSFVGERDGTERTPAP